MKSKKWIVVTIISLVLIAASVVFAFVWMLPMIKKNSALNKLAEGESADIAEMIADMDADQKTEIKKDVNDVVVYSVNQYLDGKKNYNETYKVLKAVEQIKACRGMSAEGFRLMNIPKLKQIYEEGVQLYTEDKNDAYDEKEEEFSWIYHAKLKDVDEELYYNWDSAARGTYDEAVQSALDEVLKEKYDEFSAGTVTYEEVKKYDEVAKDFWYSDYAFEVSNELYYDEYFQERLADYQKDYDEKEYFDVLDNIRYLKENYSGEKAWDRWKDRFEELNNKAEETGKTYYVDQAIQYVNDGDTYEAEWLMSRMKSYFGEDFDLSKVEEAIKANTHEEWMEEYVALMDNWKSELNNDLPYAGMTAELIDCKQLSADIINPQNVVLYDFNNDGVPELALKGAEYTAVYAYNGYGTELTGVITLMGVGNPPYAAIALTQEIEEGVPAYAEALIRYKEECWFLDKIVATTSYLGEVYYLGRNDDGDVEMISETDYLAIKKEIEENVKGDLPAGVGINDYKDYIYGYSN